MSTKKTNDERPEMSPEYDFSKGRRGRYAARYAAGTEVVLDSDTVKGPNSDQLGNTLGNPVKRSPQNKKTT